MSQQLDTPQSNGGSAQPADGGTPAPSSSQKGSSTYGAKDITVLEGLPETTTDDIIAPERREERQRTRPRAPTPPPTTAPTLPQQVQSVH